MNMTVSLKIRVIILAIIALTPFKTIGIGQTTDPIVIENALRGNEYQETMIIINTLKQLSPKSVVLLKNQ